MKLDFIKGHMGGNTIVFLVGKQIPEGRELDISLDVLGSGKVCCHEAGLLYPPVGSEDLRVRIVGRASGRFISACGGLTQVLGQVLSQTQWGEVRFGLDPKTLKTVKLRTDVGIATIRIRRETGGTTAITDMTPFLEEIYEQGFERLDLCGVSVWRIGKFLVINADDLQKALPEADIENLDDVSRNNIVMLQEAFFASSPFAGFDLALYDDKPVRQGNSFRVVFPHSIPNGLIEPSCGTGSVAVCVTAFLEGAFQDRKSVV